MDRNRVKNDTCSDDEDENMSMYSNSFEDDAIFLDDEDDCMEYSENEDFEDEIRTESKHLNEKKINSLKKFESSNMNLKIDEKTLIKLIIEDSSGKHMKNSSKNKIYSIINLYTNNSMIVGLIMNILKTYLPDLSNSDKFCVLIFFKNYFAKIYEYFKTESKKLKKLKKKQEKNEDEYDNNFLDENGLNNLNNLTLKNQNESNPPCIISLSSMSSELIEILYLLIKYLNSDETFLSEKIKIHIKDIIRYIAMLTSKISGNSIFFQNILNDIKKEISENLESSLKYSNLINFLHIYDSILGNSRDFIYDEDKFHERLFMIEFIFNNFENIDYSSQRGVIDANLIKMKKISLLKIIISTISNFTQNNLSNISRKISEINIDVSSISSISGISSINNDNPNHVEISISNHPKKFFFDNLKYLKIIELLMHLDPETLLFSSSNRKLLFFEKSDHRILPLKNTLLEQMVSLTKFYINNIQENAYYSANQNFIDFISLLFEEFIRFLGEVNREVQIYLVKDDSCPDLEFSIYLSTVLRFLSYAVWLKSDSGYQIKELVNKNQSEILRYVLMPLMRESIAEKEAFFICSDDFVKLVYDYTFYQRNASVKSRIYAFILKLCEISHQFLDFISQVAIEMLGFKLRLDFVDLGLDFSYKYILPEQSNIFASYLQNEFNEEEFFEITFQLISALQEKLYFSNRKVFNSIDIIIKKLFKDYLNNISSEFIRAKLALLCFSNLKLKLNSILIYEKLLQSDLKGQLHYDPETSNTILQINSVLNSESILDDQIASNSTFLYLNFILENLFNNIHLSGRNFSTNVLCLELLTDLLFNKNYLAKPEIKNLFKLFLAKHFNKFQIILCLGDNSNKIEFTNHQEFNSFIIKLTEKYFNELENEMFLLFNYLLNEVSQEIEKFYSSKQNSNKKISAYSSKHKVLSYIKAIHELVINCQKSSCQNDVLKMNIFNKFVESITHNTKKFFKFNYEEDLMKVNVLILKDIRELNEKLYSYLVVEYFKEIKNDKFGFKPVHVEFVIQMMKLVKISNEEIILSFKKEIFNLFNLSITYIDKDSSKGTNDQFYICSLMFVYLLNFSSLGDGRNFIEVSDYTNLIKQLIERLRNRTSNIYPGPLASRMFLLFHLIILILDQENKLNEALKLLHTRNFEYMIQKMYTICSDQDYYENNITIRFCMKILTMALDSFNEDNFESLSKLFQFTIINLSYQTYKNISECSTEEKELMSSYNLNDKKISTEFVNSCLNKSMAIKNGSNKCNSPKKLFGIKHTSELEEKEFICSQNKTRESNMNKLDHLEFYDNREDSEKEEYDSEFYESSETERLNDDSYEFPCFSEEDSDEIFLLNLEQKNDLKKFNENMTAEKFLKRMKYEYSTKKVREYI